MKASNLTEVTFSFFYNLTKQCFLICTSLHHKSFSHILPTVSRTILIQFSLPVFFTNFLILITGLVSIPFSHITRPLFLKKGVLAFPHTQVQHCHSILRSTMYLSTMNLAASDLGVRHMTPLLAPRFHLQADINADFLHISLYQNLNFRNMDNNRHTLPQLISLQA